MYLQICGSFKSAKSNWVRKSEILKIPQLRKVSKSKNTLVRKFAELRFADLIREPPTFALY